MCHSLRIRFTTLTVLRICHNNNAGLKICHSHYNECLKLVMTICNRKHTLTKNTYVWSGNSHLVRRGLQSRVACVWFLVEGILHHHETWGFEHEQRHSLQTKRYRRARFTNVTILVNFSVTNSVLVVCIRQGGATTGFDFKWIPILGKYVFHLLGIAPQFLLYRSIVTDD